MNHMLRMINRSLVVMALFLSTLALASHHEQSEAEKNLVQVAANNDDFQTLVMAIKAADLVGTLEGKVSIRSKDMQEIVSSTLARPPCSPLH